MAGVPLFVPVAAEQPRVLEKLGSELIEKVSVDDETYSTVEEEPRFDEKFLIEDSKQGADDNDDTSDDVKQVPLWLQLQFFGNNPHFADELPRKWQSHFHISFLQNLEARKQRIFVVVRFGHKDPDFNLSNQLKTARFYSGLYTILGGRKLSLLVPTTVWNDKEFTLSIEDMDSFVIDIQIWEYYPISYNILYGEARMTLTDVLSEGPRLNLDLNRELRSGNRVLSVPVHKLQGLLTLEEQLDYRFTFYNWSLFLIDDIAKPDFRCYLALKVPTSSKNEIKTIKTGWMRGYNLSMITPKSFTFRGTRSALQRVRAQIEVMGAQSIGGVTSVGQASIPLASIMTSPIVRAPLRCNTRNFDSMGVGYIQISVASLADGADAAADEVVSTSRRLEQKPIGVPLPYLLDPNSVYLIVRVIECRRLIPGDLERNTSDCIVEAIWDGFSLTSEIVEASLSPVFNQNFYFPLKVISERNLKHTLFGREHLGNDIQARGPVKLLVWHVVSEIHRELLATYLIDLSSIEACEILSRNVNWGQDGALQDKNRPFDHDENYDLQTYEDIASQQAWLKASQDEVWYEKMHSTRVKKVEYAELETRDVPGTAIDGERGKPTMSFEFFFIPDIPNGIEWPKIEWRSKDQLWAKQSERWDRDFLSWCRVYSEWFPKALFSQRTFPVTSRVGFDLRERPLCMFLKAIESPRALSSPGSLLYWLGSIGFTDTKCNRITHWKPAGLILNSKKGSIQDHAALLTSILLGLNYDAYVCKGTIDGGKRDYAWSMTRGTDGWVTMWDPVTLKRFPMPLRWGIDDRISAQAAADYDGTGLSSLLRQVGGTTTKTKRSSLKFPLMAARVERENEEDLPMERPMLREELVEVLGLGTPTAAPVTAAGEIGPIIRDNIRDTLETLTIAPIKSLTDEKLKAYLPYSSLEVCFNEENVWGNLQNAHPSYIYYDFESPVQWRPFLIDRNTESIDEEIYFQPLPPQSICQKLEVEIASEFYELIQVVRSEIGTSFQVNHDAEVIAAMKLYLRIMDFRAQLDPQTDPGPPSSQVAWSAIEANGLRDRLVQMAINRQHKGGQTTLLDTNDMYEELLVDSFEGQIQNPVAALNEVTFMTGMIHGETRPTTTAPPATLNWVDAEVRENIRRELSSEGVSLALPMDIGDGDSDSDPLDIMRQSSAISAKKLRPSEGSRRRTYRLPTIKDQMDSIQRVAAELGVESARQPGSTSQARPASEGDSSTLYIDCLADSQVQQNFLGEYDAHGMLNPIEDYGDLGNVLRKQRSSEVVDVGDGIPGLSDGVPGFSDGDGGIREDNKKGMMVGERHFQSAEDLDKYLKAFYENPQIPYIYREPMLDAEYFRSQLFKWGRFYEIEDDFYKWHKTSFPQPAGASFCGFCARLATTGEQISLLADSGRSSFDTEGAYSEQAFPEYFEITNG